MRLPFGSLIFYLLSVFIRNNLKQAISDKEREEIEHNFHPNNRRENYRYSHQNIDLDNDFFFRSLAIDFVSRKSAT